MEFSWIHIPLQRSCTLEIIRLSFLAAPGPRFLRCFLYHVGPFACQTWSSLNVTVAHVLWNSTTMIYHILHPGFSTIVTIFQHAPPFSLLMPSCACLKTKNKKGIYDVLWPVACYYIQKHPAFAESKIYKSVGDFPLHKHLLIGIVNAVEITCTASTWEYLPRSENWRNLAPPKE